jgi:uncharacterized protein YuzE
MNIEYDQTVDAAYIYVGGKIAPGGVATSYHCNPAKVGGIINLDFDVEGRLIGIEILDARLRLPPEALAAFDSKEQ